jgi:hypothetical protein
MSNKAATLIGIVVVLLLFIEITGDLIAKTDKDEKKNPLDSSGKIKAGYTVSLEEEKKLALASFPKVTEKDYNEQLMYAFSQCILTSVSMNSYECIGNNVANSYFTDAQKNLSPNEKGKLVYTKLVKYKTPTGVNTTLLQGEKEQYQLTINVLESKNPFQYVVTLNNKKIETIIEREGNK